MDRPVVSKIKEYDEIRGVMLYCKHDLKLNVCVRVKFKQNHCTNDKCIAIFLLQNLEFFEFFLFTSC